MDLDKRYVRPDAESAAAGVSLAGRVLVPDRPRVAIIENGKPQAKKLLLLIMDEIQTLLGGNVETQVVSHPPLEQLSDGQDKTAILSGSDVVLAGVGDCGGCMSFSLQDVAMMEQGGLPCAVVVTHEFEKLARTFAASIGMDPLPIVSVPHPLTSALEVDLRSHAQRVAPEVVCRWGVGKSTAGQSA